MPGPEYLNSPIFQKTIHARSILALFPPPPREKREREKKGTIRKQLVPSREALPSPVSVVATTGEGVKGTHGCRSLHNAFPSPSLLSAGPLLGHRRPTSIPSSSSKAPQIRQIIRGSKAPNNCLSPSPLDACMGKFVLQGMTLGVYFALCWDRFAQNDDR